MATGHLFRFPGSMGLFGGFFFWILFAFPIEIENYYCHIPDTFLHYIEYLAKSIQKAIIQIIVKKAPTFFAVPFNYWVLWVGSGA